MNNKETEVISVLNNKGGVLKTTSLLNIAFILAKLGNKVLVVDADGQANSTASFDIFNEKYKGKFEDGQFHTDFIKNTTIDILKIDKDNRDTSKIMKTIEDSIFKDVFVSADHEIENIKKQINLEQGRINFYKKAKNSSEKIDSIIKEHESNILKLSDKIKEISLNTRGSIDLIAANSDLRLFEREMLKEMRVTGKYQGNSKLQNVLSFLKMSYDFILIDAPPSLGMISENIMAAATKLIVPMEMETYSIQGVSNIINTYYDLKEDYPTIKLAAILPTKINTRLKIHQDSYKSLAKYLKEHEPEFFKSLLPFEDGVRLSGKSATELGRSNKTLSEQEWFKKNDKKHQNVNSYIKLVKEYIL